MTVKVIGPSREATAVLLNGYHVPLKLSSKHCVYGHGVVWLSVLLLEGSLGSGH